MPRPSLFSLCFISRYSTLSGTDFIDDVGVLLRVLEFFPNGDFIDSTGFLLLSSISFLAVFFFTTCFLIKEGNWRLTWSVVSLGLGRKNS